MKLLCYVRPWNYNQFRSIVSNISSISSVTYFSEHRNCDDSHFVESYYYHLKSLRYSKTDYKTSLSTFENNDIISRCRLLRNLPIKKANLHLAAMEIALYQLLDKEQPNYVLSITIDSFVLDVLYHLCIKRNLKFIGLVPSFLNGYFRVTSRGEYNKLRSPKSFECDQAISSLLRDNYTPKFISNAKNNPRIILLKRVIKNILKPLYFLTRRIFSNDPYNYHFWSSQIVSLLHYHIIPCFTMGDKNWRRFSNNRKSIYVPLQMYPECTIDYWCDEIKFVDYDNSLIQLLTKLSSTFIIYVKEHPGVIGLRNPSLYSKLRKIKNVYIVPTFVDSNEVLQTSSCVLVWTGSVGFESVLRGKPVLTVCKPYYRHGLLFKSVNLETDPKTLEQFIDLFSDNYNSNHARNLINNLLSCLLLGKFLNDGTWSNKNENDINDSVLIGHALEKNIFSKNK